MQTLNLTGKAKQHPPSLQRNPVAGDGKRPWIMSPTSPVELFLNILVKRFQKVFRRQYKVPKPLSVHAISAYLLIFIWTFCVLVAASLSCDITGEKKLIIFPPNFQLSLELTALSLNARTSNFIEKTKRQPQNSSGTHWVFYLVSQPEVKHSQWWVTNMDFLTSSVQI